MITFCRMPNDEEYEKFKRQVEKIYDQTGELISVAEYQKRLYRTKYAEAVWNYRDKGLTRALTGIDILYSDVIGINRKVEEEVPTGHVDKNGKEITSLEPVLKTTKVESMENRFGSLEEVGDYLIKEASIKDNLTKIWKLYRGVWDSDDARYVGGWETTRSLTAIKEIFNRMKDENLQWLMKKYNIHFDEKTIEDEIKQMEKSAAENNSDKIEQSLNFFRQTPLDEIWNQTLDISVLKDKEKVIESQNKILEKITGVSMKELVEHSTTQREENIRRSQQIDEDVIRNVVNKQKAIDTVKNVDDFVNSLQSHGIITEKSEVTDFIESVKKFIASDLDIKDYSVISNFNSKIQKGFEKRLKELEDNHIALLEQAGHKKAIKDETAKLKALSDKWTNAQKNFNTEISRLKGIKDDYNKRVAGSNEEVSNTLIKTMSRMAQFSIPKNDDRLQMLQKKTQAVYDSIMNNTEYSDSTSRQVWKVAKEFVKLHIGDIKKLPLNYFENGSKGIKKLITEESWVQAHLEELKPLVGSEVELNKFVNKENFEVLYEAALNADKVRGVDKKQTTSLHEAIEKNIEKNNEIFRQSSEEMTKEHLTKVSEVMDILSNLNTIKEESADFMVKGKERIDAMIKALDFDPHKNLEVAKRIANAIRPNILDSIIDLNRQDGLKAYHIKWRQGNMQKLVADGFLKHNEKLSAMIYGTEKNFIFEAMEMLDAWKYIPGGERLADNQSAFSTMWDLDLGNKSEELLAKAELLNSLDNDEAYLVIDQAVKKQSGWKTKEQQAELNKFPVQFKDEYKNLNITQSSALAKKVADSINNAMASVEGINKFLEEDKKFINSLFVSTGASKYNMMYLASEIDERKDVSPEVKEAIKSFAKEVKGLITWDNETDDYKFNMLLKHLFKNDQTMTRITHEVLNKNKLDKYIEQEMAKNGRLSLDTIKLNAAIKENDKFIEGFASIKRASRNLNFNIKTLRDLQRIVTTPKEVYGDTFKDSETKYKQIVDAHRAASDLIISKSANALSTFLNDGLKEIDFDMLVEERSDKLRDIVSYAKAAGLNVMFKAESNTLKGTMLAEQAHIEGKKIKKPVFVVQPSTKENTIKFNVYVPHFNGESYELLNVAIVKKSNDERRTLMNTGMLWDPRNDEKIPVITSITPNNENLLRASKTFFDAVYAHKESFIMKSATNKNAETYSYTQKDLSEAARVMKSTITNLEELNTNLTEIGNLYQKQWKSRSSLGQFPAEVIDYYDDFVPKGYASTIDWSTNQSLLYTMYKTFHGTRNTILAEDIDFVNTGARPEKISQPTEETKERKTFETHFQGEQYELRQAELQKAFDNQKEISVKETDEHKRKNAKPETISHFYERSIQTYNDKTELRSYSKKMAFAHVIADTLGIYNNEKMADVLAEERLKNIYNLGGYQSMTFEETQNGLKVTAVNNNPYDKSYNEHKYSVTFRKDGSNVILYHSIDNVSSLSPTVWSANNVETVEHHEIANEFMNSVEGTYKEKDKATVNLMRNFTRSRAIEKIQYIKRRVYDTIIVDNPKITTKDFVNQFITNMYSLADTSGQNLEPFEPVFEALRKVPDEVRPTEILDLIKNLSEHATNDQYGFNRLSKRQLEEAVLHIEAKAKWPTPAAAESMIREQEEAANEFNKGYAGILVNVKGFHKRFEELTKEKEALEESSGSLAELEKVNKKIADLYITINGFQAGMIEARQMEIEDKYSPLLQQQYLSALRLRDEIDSLEKRLKTAKRQKNNKLERSSLIGQLKLKKKELGDYDVVTATGLIYNPNQRWVRNHDWINAEIGNEIKEIENLQNRKWEYMKEMHALPKGHEDIEAIQSIIRSINNQISNIRTKIRPVISAGTPEYMKLMLKMLNNKSFDGEYKSNIPDIQKYIKENEKEADQKKITRKVLVNQFLVINDMQNKRRDMMEMDFFNKVSEMSEEEFKWFSDSFGVDVSKTENREDAIDLLLDNFDGMNEKEAQDKFRTYSTLEGHEHAFNELFDQFFNVNGDNLFTHDMTFEEFLESKGLADEYAAHEDTARQYDTDDEKGEIVAVDKETPYTLLLKSLEGKRENGELTRWQDLGRQDDTMVSWALRTIHRAGKKRNNLINVNKSSPEIIDHVVRNTPFKSSEATGGTASITTRPELFKSFAEIITRSLFDQMEHIENEKDKIETTEVVNHYDPENPGKIPDPCSI